MPRQKISIYLHNVVGCLKFLMDHSRFWHNQIYKSFFVFNKNENIVYNKMHTDKWC